jgi:hypothetical protein
MRTIINFGMVSSALAFSAIEEDARGLVDPGRYESVFAGPDGRVSNLIQKEYKKPPTKKSSVMAPLQKQSDSYVAKLFHTVESYLPAFSLVQTRDWSQWFSPFSTTEAAKSASLKLAAAQEALADKEAATKSKIEAFKNEIQLQIESAKSEKRRLDERLAQRGSLLQIRTDFAQHEIEKINEMSRHWKLDADRIAHIDLNAEPDAAVVAAMTKVESDKKKMRRIEAAIQKDLEAVESDEAVVVAQQAQLRKEKQLREYATGKV